MAVGCYSKEYLYTFVRNILVVSFFLNYVGLSKAEVSSEIESQVLHLLEPFDKLPSLPKNYPFSDDELNNYWQEYLAGLNNEDIYLNGSELIEKYGYTVEEHHATTVDGYILTLYRIPSKGPVVFLMHGFLSSFVDFLTGGPDKGLPYLLAALGYDVWMGNARGNDYSKKNIRLSPSDSKFWDFSWDEIGRFDLPAMIDYVLNTTNQKSLTYVGHSQGTTTFFVLCSERPEYCTDKIKLMIALSAVAWMKHATNPILQAVAPFNPLIEALGKAIGLNDVAPDTIFKKAIARTICGNNLLASTVCSNVLFLLCGFDYPEIDYKQSSVIFNHTPSGASLKQFIHYAQLVVSGYFRQFDYGKTMNFVHYNSSTPPSYPVDKISVPVGIYLSPGDWLANPIDVDLLNSKLSNVVDYHQISLPTFNHADYIFAKHVKTLLYDRVLKLINEYNNEEGN